MTESIGDAVLGISTDQRGFDRDIDRAERKARGLDRQFENISRRLRRLAGLVATAFAVREMVEFAGEATSAALRMEALEQQFRIAAGSVAGANQEFGFARDIAERLGLELESTASGYVKFAVAVKGTALEGEAARDVFESVAIASAGMRLSAEQTAGVMTALEQIVSKGKVSAEELRGQLGERLPGAFRLAAESIGVTTAELDDMLRKGELTAEELLPNLARRLKEEFGPAAVEAGNSAQGAFSRWSTAIFELKASIGEALLPIMSTLAVALTEVVTEIGPKVAEFFRENLPGAVNFTLEVFVVLARNLAALKLVFETAITGIMHLWDLLVGTIKVSAAGIIRSYNFLISAMREFEEESFSQKRAFDSIQNALETLALGLEQEGSKSFDSIRERSDEFRQSIIDTEQWVRNLEAGVESLQGKITNAGNAAETAATQYEGLARATEAANGVTAAWADFTLPKTAPLIKDVAEKTNAAADKAKKYATEVAGATLPSTNFFDTFRTGNQSVDRFISLAGNILGLLGKLGGAFSSAGQSAGGFFSKLGGLFGGGGGGFNFSNLLGGLGGLLPGAGLIGAGIGGLVSLLSGLGGPSQDELKARGIVDNLNNSMRNLVDTAGLLPAVGADWEKQNLAQAKIIEALGGNMADVEDIWRRFTDPQKNSADATAFASFWQQKLDELQKKMDETGMSFEELWRDSMGKAAETAKQEFDTIAKHTEDAFTRVTSAVSERMADVFDAGSSSLGRAFPSRVPVAMSGARPVAMRSSDAGDVMQVQVVGGPQTRGNLQAWAAQQLHGAEVKIRTMRRG